LACVEQPEYDINDQKPASKHYVWFLQGDMGGNAALGPSGTCSNKTLAEVFACARSAAESHPSVATCGGAFEWNAPSAYGTPGDYQDWQQTGSAKLPNGTHCNGLSFRTRAVAGWPSGYVHEVCEADCESLMNERQLGTHTGNEAYSPPADICVDGCAAFKRDIQTTSGPTRYWRVNDGGGVFSYLVSYQFTGLPCDGETSVPAEDMAGSGEACVGDFCRSPQTGENCGFLNDTYTCLSQTEPDKCFKNSNGSVICAEAAPIPAVPDSGTAGVPATPDATVESCTGAGACSSTNYYNSTTVSNSSRPVPDGGGTGGAGPIGGDGAGEEPGYAKGTSSGGASCDAPPTCTHDDPVQCAALEQQWRTRCVDAPLEADVLASIGATEAEMEGDLTGGADPIDVTSLNAEGGFSGSCPTPISVSVMGQTLELDIWIRACEMAVLFAPIVMMIGYLSAAAIIVKGVG
jgi:hypothetical protein